MYKTALLVAGFALISAYFSLGGLVPLLALSSLKDTVLGIISPAIPNSNSTAIPTTTNLTSENMAAAAVARSVSRSVVKKVFAQEQEEGVGARVRRSIGSQGLRNLTPFLMLDHFQVGKGAGEHCDERRPNRNLRNCAGFDDHPHRGQATVTYLLEGYACSDRLF
jgi:hypothetical protein